MNWLIKLFEFNMTKPELYGWFHILCLILTGVLVILLLKQKTEEKKIRRVLGITAVIAIILEIYKQLYFCIDGWHLCHALSGQCIYGKRID